MGQRIDPLEKGAIELALNQMEMSVALVRQYLSLAEEALAPTAAERESQIAADAKLASVATEIFRFRRIRTKAFRPALLGEPAWDILLDLFEKTAREEAVSISSACIAASVPGTTALRWLNVLLNEGLVERYSHDADGRVSLVRLTSMGMSLTRDCLSRHAGISA
jgi:DNA-binding MarR family transcriptional regulator